MAVLEKEIEKMIEPYYDKQNPRLNAVLVLAIIAAIIIGMCLCSCSPEKTLAKLQKNHPELFQAKIITTVHHDTLISKEIHKDSIINNIYSRDTVYIKEGRETVKYVYETGSKAYISADVKADTIIKIDTVKSKQTTIIKQVKEPRTAIEWLQFWLFWCIVIYLVVRYGGPVIMKLLRLIPKFPF